MNNELNLTGRAVPLSPCIAAAAIAACVQTAPAQPPATFRPPAVPLVTHDPYFSAWSFSDHLTDDWVRHWTGRIQALTGYATIDGHAYRFMGPWPHDVPAMQQARLEVTPTRSVYEFTAAGINLSATFLSPLLPGDPDLMSRPTTHLTLTVTSADGAEHAVKLYCDASAEWAVNTPDQKVRWSRTNTDSLNVLSFSSLEQPVLAKAGDDLRIDWGSFYLALPAGPHIGAVIGGHEASRRRFLNSGSLLSSDDPRQPRAADDDWPVLACSIDLGMIGGNPASTTIFLGYDDGRSIEYFGRPLRPYWQRQGTKFQDILAAAARDHAQIDRRCREFDGSLMNDLRTVGGEKYASLAALGFRQTIAACKLVVDADGTPLMFPKENFSNGCIGTVDVIFPTAPFFLLFNPSLLKAQLCPVMNYAASSHWKFPFAPHDLGTYPKANGQVYGGGERTEQDQMPVEESGNMLILLGLIAELDGNADFARRWWPTVTRWAEYLAARGLDPENQLCTDDFAGHLAHNANLSIKAIIGLNAYARLCEASGQQDDAAKYRALAARFADQWTHLADDGDHYRLTFDRPGTWSQKYNLFWDRLFHAPIFPTEIAQRELTFYRSKLDRFGLPLDSRASYTKVDSVAFTAAMLRTDGHAATQPLLDLMYDFADATPDRVPLTDWYDTRTGKCQGFRARSVVGGLYAPMLTDQVLWRKWAASAVNASPSK